MNTLEVYHHALAIGGLTPEQAADPSALTDVQRANVRWAQQYALDVAKGQPPEHWHPAFKQEKLTGPEWIRAWAAPIPPALKDRVQGKGP